MDCLLPSNFLKLWKKDAQSKFADFTKKEVEILKRISLWKNAPKIYKSMRHERGASTESSLAKLQAFYLKLPLMNASIHALIHGMVILCHA